MRHGRPFDLSQPHRLGKRAFLLFLDKRLLSPSTILLISLTLWAFRIKIPSEYLPYTNRVTYFGFLLFLVVFAIKFLLTVFEYLGYSYQFDEEFFQVNRGYFARHENAIAYHQIQNVNIKRGVLFRLMGLSKLIIVLSRASAQGSGDVDVVLPALDRHRAKLIQKELLHRARKHLFSAEKDPPATENSNEESAEEGEE